MWPVIAGWPRRLVMSGHQAALSSVAGHQPAQSSGAGLVSASGNICNSAIQPAAAVAGAGSNQLSLASAAGPAVAAAFCGHHRPGPASAISPSIINGVAGIRRGISASIVSKAYQASAASQRQRLAAWRKRGNLGQQLSAYGSSQPSVSMSKCSVWRRRHRRQLAAMARPAYHGVIVAAAAYPIISLAGISVISAGISWPAMAAGWHQLPCIASRRKCQRISIWRNHQHRQLAASAWLAGWQHQRFSASLAAAASAWRSWRISGCVSQSAYQLFVWRHQLCLQLAWRNGYLMANGAGIHQYSAIIISQRQRSWRLACMARPAGCGLHGRLQWRHQRIFGPKHQPYQWLSGGWR